MFSFPNPNFRTKTTKTFASESPERNLGKVFISPKKTMPGILSGEPSLSQSFNLKALPVAEQPKTKRISVIDRLAQGTVASCLKKRANFIKKDTFERPFTP